MASQLVYKSFGTESMPGLRRAAAALSDCSRSLALDVPAPPSARLAAVLLKAHRACERYAVVAKAVRTTRTAVVYGVLSDRLVRVLRQAHEHLGASVDGALVGVGRPVVRSSAASTMLSHIDPVLGSVASMLAGHPVDVRCWSDSNWRHIEVEAAALNGRRPAARPAGWTRVGGDGIDLSGRICHRLELLAAQPRPPRARSFATADAIRVLTHESQHAAGDSDEAVTECHALQRVAETAQDIGVGTADAGRLALLAWSTYQLEPARYRTSACHNGGSYDLRPSNPSWP